MGLFKEMRQFQQMSNEMTAGYERPGLTDTLKMANQTMGDLMAQQQKAMRLMHEGIVGQGTIISMRDTGVTINDDPEVEFEIAVQTPDRPAYRVTHRQAISRLVIGSFQVGSGVPVRVDPADANSILIA